MERRIQTLDLESAWGLSVGFISLHTTMFTFCHYYYYYLLLLLPPYISIFELARQVSLPYPLD